MINQTQYFKLQQIKETNPEIYSFICEIMDEHYKLLGTASHDIKNIISFINSAYQFVARQHPEAAEFDFFNDMGKSTKELIHFMCRTSYYRYTLTYEPELINLSDFLYALPEEAEEVYPDAKREFYYDLPPKDIEICADYAQFGRALDELVFNCYDATSDGDTIYVKTAFDDAHKNITITISNKGMLEPIMFSPAADIKRKPYACNDCDILCRPFYTTKKKPHIGLGLSMVHNVCMTHQGYLEFEQNGDMTSAHMTIPLLEAPKRDHPLIRF